MIAGTESPDASNITRKTGKNSTQSTSLLSVVMFNAQSLRSKLNEFRCFIAVYKPDIICVTETWVSESFCGDRLEDFEVQGYNLFSYCRESRQGGGYLYT